MSHRTLAARRCPALALAQAILNRLAKPNQYWLRAETAEGEPVDSGESRTAGQPSTDKGMQRPGIRTPAAPRGGARQSRSPLYYATSRLSSGEIE
jgi:hypothetical protein